MNSYFATHIKILSILSLTALSACGMFDNRSSNDKRLDELYAMIAALDKANKENEAQAIPTGANLNQDLEITTAIPLRAGTSQVISSPVAVNEGTCNERSFLFRPDGVPFESVSISNVQMRNGRCSATVSLDSSLLEAVANTDQMSLIGEVSYNGISKNGNVIARYGLSLVPPTEGQVTKAKTEEVQSANPNLSADALKELLKSVIETVYIAQADRAKQESKAAEEAAAKKAAEEKLAAEQKRLAEKEIQSKTMEQVASSRGGNFPVALNVRVDRTVQTDPNDAKTQGQFTMLPADFSVSSAFVKTKVDLPGSFEDITATCTYYTSTSDKPVALGQLRIGFAGSSVECTKFPLKFAYNKESREIAVALNAVPLKQMFVTWPQAPNCSVVPVTNDNYYQVYSQNYVCQQRWLAFNSGNDRYVLQGIPDSFMGPADGWMELTVRHKAVDSNGSVSFPVKIYSFQIGLYVNGKANAQLLADFAQKAGNLSEFSKYFGEQANAASTPK